MNTSQPLERIFDPDEMNLVQPQPGLTRDELLDIEGIFLLKHVAAKLDIDSNTIKKQVARLEKEGKSSWEIIGVKKVWTNWILRMKVFAPYYRKHLEAPYEKLNKDWDANILLEQEGRFLLAEVCKLLPFSSHQLRYQAKKVPDSRARYGIWKDKGSGQFIVELPVFANWIRSLWNEGMPKKTAKKRKPSVKEKN